MKFSDSIKQRYTTKVYDPQKKVSSTIIEELKETLHLAPSSINSQPWKFRFVESEEMKTKLSEVSLFNKEKVEHCSAVVVFQRYNNIVSFESWMMENMLEGQINYYNSFVKPKGEEYILEWFSRQVYLALGVFLSGCAALGVDSTPMEGIQCDKYDEILNTDDNDFKTLFAVALGFRDPSDWNLPEKSPKKRKNKAEVITQIK